MVFQQVNGRRTLAQFVESESRDKKECVLRRMKETLTPLMEKGWLMHVLCRVCMCLWSLLASAHVHMRTLHAFPAGICTHHMIHVVLLDYLRHADEAARDEMIGLAKDLVVEMCVHAVWLAPSLRHDGSNQSTKQQQREKTSFSCSCSCSSCSSSSKGCTQGRAAW